VAGFDGLGFGKLGLGSGPHQFLSCSVAGDIFDTR
jgi:hypothetical protein